MIGVIFRKAQNKIQDPAKLRRLIELIDGETWIGLDVDVKGEIYEGLLEKNAQDIKSGAGQYFTPRPLIKAMVDVMRPAPGETICDPACGTGGFLLAAHDYVDEHTHRWTASRGSTCGTEALHGWEIVDSAARLCVMNLYLHGIGANGGDQPDPRGRQPGRRSGRPLRRGADQSALRQEEQHHHRQRRRRGQARAQIIVREDFWTTTSNKQLNFLQHVKTLLKINGRAAVVVPDNVLFEGGAGETVRRKLLHECDVHTLLRLPTGIFYAQGVKANVLFFDRKPASEKPWTEKLWIYDLRTNMHFTLKQNPLTRADLDEFVACYNPENRHERKPPGQKPNPAGPLAGLHATTN